MSNKPTYEELEQKIEELEKESVKLKKAKRALQESEERYRAMVTAFDGLIYVCSHEYQIEFMNERFIERTGYDPTGNLCYTALHGLESVCPWCVNEQVFSGKTVRWEVQSPKDDRWYYVVNTPINNHDGSLSKLAMIIDITNRKQMDLQLHESEEKYRILMKALPTVVYKGYKDWSIELIDNKIEKLTGYTSDTFNSGNLKWSDIIVGEDLEIAKDNFIKALKTEKAYTREYRIRDISGEIKWIQDRGNIVLNNRGEIEYVSGVFIDITNRKKQEAEYDKNRELLKTVFDGIPDPLVLLDESLRVKIINQAAMRYYNVEKPDDIREICCFEAFMGKSAPCDDCQIPAMIANRKSGSFERKGILNPNKLELIHIYNFYKIDRSFGGALIRIHDITESRLMERKMIHNEKLVSLGLTISCITHEISNPISAITLNAPILKDYINAMVPIVDDYAKDREDFGLFQMSYPRFREDILKIVTNILHASNRINTLVSNLRKLYSPKKAQNKEWVDIKQLIDKINAAIGVEVNQYVKSFEINVPENLPKIFTDPDAVEQILTNLLINAAHAADKEDSWVRFDVTQGENWRDHFIIELRDNGCGMDQETLTKIFTPFFTTKATGQGSGLGLYVSKDLIEDLDGQIEVQSEPGSGSVFRVVLPDIERRSAKRL